MNIKQVEYLLRRNIAWEKNGEFPEGKIISTQRSGKTIGRLNKRATFKTARTLNYSLGGESS